MTVATNRRQRRREKSAANKRISAEGQKSLWRAVSYLRRYKKLTAAAYGALALALVAQLAVPQFVQRIIDTITINANRKDILTMAPDLQQAAAQKLGIDPASLQIDLSQAPRALLTGMIVIIVLSLVRGVLSFAQNYMAQILSENVAFEFRNDIFAKIQRLSFSYHDRNQTGQLMIRATDDVEKLRAFIGRGVLVALQAVVLLVGTLTLLVVTNIQLTLLVVPLLPLTMFVFGLFGARSQPLFREVQQRLSRVNTILQENLAGIKVVRAFASEDKETARFNNSIDRLLNQRLIISKVFSFLFPGIFLLALLAQAAVLYFGGRQIINGLLTVGEWQKFSLYLTYLFLPMGQLGFIISITAQAATSAQRIFEILDAKNDVENRPDAHVLEDIEGHVTFDNVTFRYFASSDPVLRDVTFQANPGQTIALLGSTGSGKTTIINLIPRFYDASEGRILIDGQDVRDVTIESLRQRIGIVLQETTLFSGTIRDNIAFGRPDASEEEVINAAKAAAAHDFIMSFPQGYDTPVGERGSTLSGGQKQRVAIARALLLDPHILILDDSTSSVDLTTEYQIQQALDRLMKGRTSFVIAQRISTVINADQILVLDKGSIVAQGTHEELLENSPIYADIYNSQLQA
ncbi:MAG: ABC transporter ATP-binding protein [Anaerolineales bacterium]|nr:ABC transporter ATP-binding protein [Anaerolineales bacterium]MCB8952345.1 ABC transporter ATP-binding protein [Ardenticatenales bacterium]